VLNTRWHLVKSFHRVERLEKTVEKTRRDPFIKDSVRARVRTSKKQAPRPPKEVNPKGVQAVKIISMPPMCFKDPVLDKRTGHKIPKYIYSKKEKYGIKLSLPLVNSDLRLLDETYRTLYSLKLLCNFTDKPSIGPSKKAYHRLRRYFSKKSTFSSSRYISRFLSICGTDLRLSVRTVKSGKPSR
jgi:hypothetical protein